MLMPYIKCFFSSFVQLQTFNAAVRLTMRVLRIRRVICIDGHMYFDADGFTT